MDKQIEKRDMHKLMYPSIHPPIPIQERFCWWRCGLGQCEKFQLGSCQRTTPGDGTPWDTGTN